MKIKDKDNSFHSALCGLAAGIIEGLVYNI